MKRDWSTDEIVEHFMLLPTEHQFLGIKDQHNRLGKALLLKYFQYESRFPESADEIPKVVIAYVAQQREVSETLIKQYDWTGRRSSEHRKDIRELLGFHPATVVDQDELRDWLISEILPNEYRPRYLEEMRLFGISRGQCKM